MKVSYLEASETRDLVEAINAAKGVKPISFVIRGNRVGAFVEAPDDFAGEIKVARARPKAALEHEARMKAQAEAEAKAAKAEPEAKAPSKKTKVGKDPGPIVE